MAHRHTANHSTRNETVRMPGLTSYDSSHEHSLEHWLEVQTMVREAAEEPVAAAPTADHGILVAA